MDTLHVLIAILASVEAGLLAFGDLEGFDAYFIYTVLVAQACAVYGLWSKNDIVLKATHLVFGASLTICALFARSPALIGFLLLALAICTYARVKDGDCSYHEHTEAWKCTREDYYLGVFTGPVVYGMPVAILTFRSMLMLLRNKDLSAEN